MKNALLLLTLLLVAVLTVSCIVIQLPADTVPNSPPAQTESATAFSPVPTLVVTPLPSPAAFETPAPSMTPYTGPKLYTSFAHMKAYDPATGKADFDYFDLLRGEDAVEWLVNNEGYDQSEAEAIVADFADSEFIEKNTNTQVRAIDLNVVDLKLMFQANGEENPDGASADASIAELNSLYAHDKSLVLKRYFYYIEVEDGIAVSVTQVYWP